MKFIIKKEKEYEKHLEYVKLNENKYYTPRGIGRRKFVSYTKLNLNI
jgi:hypothetical protein